MYTTRQVADLLEMPAWKVREYARAGFLTPARTTRGYQFNFTDLVVLRTAVRLACADAMSHRRIQRTLGLLKTQIPQDRSLTEIGIATSGYCVLVQDGSSVWEPETGQCHFNFAAGSEPVHVEPVSVLPVAAPDPAPSPISLGRAEVVAQGWFEIGCEQEADQPDDAIASYKRAISIYPKHADAHVNLGRIFQSGRKLRLAMKHYETALEIAPYNSTASFNLALAYQRAKRTDQALEMFEQTIELDPDLADAHYNLAKLYELAGRPTDALRHFQIFKKLTGSFRRRKKRR